MAAEHHEDDLPPQTRDFHRAIRSLIEELEAVDLYQQRIDTSPDEELKRVLAHNRDDEIAHASMLIEWLRRRVPKLDQQLRAILFKEGEIHVD
jgi:uncharacterized protein